MRMGMKVAISMTSTKKRKREIAGTNPAWRIDGWHLTWIKAVYRERGEGGRHEG